MPAPDGPTKATVSPALIVQVDILQHRPVRSVTEADIARSESRRAGPTSTASGRIDDIGFGIEQFGVAAETGDPLGVDLEHGVDLFDRAEEDIDQEQEADEPAVGQLAVQDEIGAGDHHDHLRQPHAEVAERHAGGHHPVGFQLGLAIAGVVAGEEPPLVVLVGERLDDADAADVLLDPGVEISHPAEERRQVPVIRPP